MAGITDFLTAEAMRKLEGLAIRSRYVSESARAGAHKSPLKGASQEFADHRQYVKGDPIRSLDWKVFGRTDRYYIKRYEEETSLRVNFIVDTSASMGYGAEGRKTKFQYACHVVAALGYIISKQQDSIGLTVYDDKIRTSIPCRSGMRHLRIVMERLAQNEPKGKTDTGKALHALAEMFARRGLIVILSDLFDDPDAVFNAVAHFRKKMHDVIVLQILDPVELELSINRVSEFIDMETGEKLEIDPTQARLAYKQELQKFIDQNRERCAVLNVDYRLVSTGEGFEDFVQQYLAERRKMSL